MNRRYLILPLVSFHRSQLSSIYHWLTNGIMTMASKDPGDVRLNDTDFMILDKLREGRNTAANLAVELDRSRKYLNTQMGYLHDYELIEKVGPLEDSGLYEITEKGRAAVEHQDLYEEDADEFDRIVAEAGSDS